MVVCLPDDDDRRCEVPLCRNCGHELVPEDRFPTTHRRESRSLWRHQCSCSFESPVHPASDAEVASVQTLLVERRLPSSELFARDVMSNLADCRTRYVFQVAEDQDVEISYDEIRQLLGHDLSF